MEVGKTRGSRRDYGVVGQGEVGGTRGWKDKGSRKD